MSRWDIQPVEVQSVLGRAQSTAGDFEDQIKALNSAMKGSATQSSSDIVAKALIGFADECANPQIKSVFARTSACLSATARAVNAYLQGDHEMVLNAQASATAAPDARTDMPGGERVAR